MNPAAPVRRAAGATTSAPTRLVVLAIAAVLALPLVLAVAVLRTRHWHPVLDLAMTEFRVRDVGGRHTPLIGLPGRIGTFPEQGSHPGPASFWLLAPVYRLAGASAWSLLVAATALSLAATAAAVWVASRQVRAEVPKIRALVVIAVVALVVQRGFGTEVLTQPWNPYLPVMVWALVLMAVWGVLLGDLRMLVIVATAGSFAAQTHIPYLGLWLGMSALVVAVVTARSVRRPEIRAEVRRWGLVSVAALGVMWSPVVIEQFRRSPGNVSRLIDHFLSPPGGETTLGWVRAIELVLRHLDVVGLAGGSLGGPTPSGGGAFVRSAYGLEAASDPGAVAVGLVVFVVWVVAAVIAWRRDLRLVKWLHVVVGWSLLLAVVSLARVFGLVWFYLTLWLWLTSVVLVVAVLWTGWAVWSARSESPTQVATMRRVGGTVVLALGAASWLAFAVDAARATAPEQHLSDTLAALVPPTAEGLVDGVGAADGLGGRYTVTYEDAANFGSLAYGLVNELERRGFEVGMPYTWRVPVTGHRVISELDATAEIRLATGRFIDTVAALPGAVAVAEHDPRDAADRERFAALRAEAESRLVTVGLDDLVAVLDDNLFGVRIDPRTPPDVVRAVDEMIRLGVPTAVFVLPAGVGR